MERVCFLPKTFISQCGNQTDLALFPRAGFAAASHGENVYVFGGSHDGRHQQTSQLWNLQFAEKLVANKGNTNHSSDFTVFLSYLGPFCGPSAATLENSVSYTYLGVGSLEEVLVVAESVDDGGDHRIKLHWPIPRVGGRILCNDDKGLYLFGGVTELHGVDYGLYLCDLWYFDFERQVWTLLWPSLDGVRITKRNADVPAPRGEEEETDRERETAEESGTPPRLLPLQRGEHGGFCSISIRRLPPSVPAYCAAGPIGGPQGRAGHVMVSDERRERVLVFGGIRKARLLSENTTWDGSRYYNDVWAWDLAASTWECLTDGELSSPAVSLATGHAFNNCLYICGGSGSLPDRDEGSQGNSSSTLRRRSLLGGLYRFHLQKRKWLPLPRIPALQRDRHSSALLGSRLYILGGFQEDVNILVNSSPLISVDLRDPESTFRVDDGLNGWGVFWQHCLLTVRPLGLDRPYLVTLGGVPETGLCESTDRPPTNEQFTYPVSRWRQQFTWLDATTPNAEVADERGRYAASFNNSVDPYSLAPGQRDYWDGNRASDHPDTNGKSLGKTRFGEIICWTPSSSKHREWSAFLLPVVTTRELQRTITSVFLRGITLVLIKSAELCAITECQQNGKCSLTVDPLLDYHVLGWL